MPKNDKQEIKFYNQREEYGCFSNYSLHSFNLDGKSWKTNEHYFQAKKFEGTKHENEVRNCRTPHMAKRMGGDRTLPLRDDWERVKEDIMYKGLKAKFEQNPGPKKILLGTGESNIKEASPNDYYWGTGARGTGQNKLGKLLVKLREELNKTNV